MDSPQGIIGSLGNDALQWCSKETIAILLYPSTRGCEVVRARKRGASSYFTPRHTCPGWMRGGCTYYVHVGSFHVDFARRLWRTGSCG